MPSRPPVLRAALRSTVRTAALALVASAVTAAVIVSGLATQTALTPASASAGTSASTSTAQRAANSALGPVDERLGRRACALLGRAWVSQGCSRTACARAGDYSRRNANAEMCFTRSGASYGRAIDVRVCRALHRPWIGEVNLCASNPARANRVVRVAPQCVGRTSDYVLVRERQTRWDECVTPGRRRQLEDIAISSDTPLRVVAAQRSRTLCALRDNTAYVDGVCRSTKPAPRDGPPEGTLLVGDSLSWRGHDELARLRPDWTLDAVPGRRVTQLKARVRAYLTGHVAPSTLVIALGTNPSSTWRKRDYLDAAAMVPAETRVLLVTPYRTAAGNDARAVARIDTYDRWMREIATTRPLTCLTDWRTLAVEQPDVLVDGTHQTPEGEDVWARLVTTSWDSCPTA